MIKRILFVDDDVNVLHGLKRMLRPMRGEWNVKIANGGEKALSMLEKEPFDVVVADMRMPGMDGAELLKIVMERFPRVVRIVLSGQADKESVLRSVGPSHQYLSKPCDAKILRETVNRAFALHDIFNSDRLSFVSRLQNIPSLPVIYQEVVKELKSEKPSIEYVSRLIKKDVAMTAKILQLVNSAYFGISEEVSSTLVAVNALGLENIRSLVLSANIFSNVKVDMPRFKMNQLWSHSTLTGNISKAICKFEEKDDKVVDDALAAGLLHDCGKLVYAVNMTEEYQKVLDVSKSENVPLYKVEKELLGASHSEVGAYLLNLWGLPCPVTEAVAFHHMPSESLSAEMSVITAVHVANAIAHEMISDAGTEINLDMEYLESLGVAHRIKKWKKLEFSYGSLPPQNPYSLPG